MPSLIGYAWLTDVKNSPLLSNNAIVPYDKKSLTLEDFALASLIAISSGVRVMVLSMPTDSTDGQGGSPL